jgi:hypothetical protein
MGNEDVRVSRAGEIIASREFYDYEDKYVLGLAETVAPTDLQDAQLERAQRVALAAYRALRVEGLARIDVFLRGNGAIVINEVNTMPGFTPISMFPMLWEAEACPSARSSTRVAAPGAARNVRRRAWTHRVLLKFPHLARLLPMGHEGPASPRWAQVRRVLHTPSVPCGVWS